MRSIMSAAGVTLLLGSLAACGGGTSAVAATPPANNTAPVSNTAPNASLLTAVQGYVDAIVSGDAAGAASYVDPACDSSDMFLAASAISGSAKGARMIVDTVYSDGTRGGADTYHLSAGAPDAFRRLIKSTFTATRAYPFHLLDGDWSYHPTPCDPPTTSTAPSTRPTASSQHAPAAVDTSGTPAHHGTMIATENDPAPSVAPSADPAPVIEPTPTQPGPGVSPTAKARQCTEGDVRTYQAGAGPNQNTEVPYSQTCSNNTWVDDPIVAPTPAPQVRD